MRAITDATGAKVESAIYRPFGEHSEWLLPGNASPETKGWIGERYDADAGLQYLNARYYDPALGLFLQPDWFEVTKPGVGTNRFSYSFNDPVNLSDPGGNDAASCSDNGTSAHCDVRRNDGVDTLTYNYKGSITESQYLDVTFEDGVATVRTTDVSLAEWAERIRSHQIEIGSTSGGYVDEFLMSEEAAYRSLFLADVLLAYGGVRKVGSLPRSKIYDNPSSLVAQRVEELGAQIPANSRSRITMGVAVVEDVNGSRAVVVSTSERGGYLRSGVTLREGETLVKGPAGSHAEADIVKYAADNELTIVAIGATRPVCGNCVDIIPADTIISTTLK